MNKLGSQETAKTIEANGVGQVVHMSTQGYQSLIKSKDGEGLHWTTDLNYELPIKMAHTGMSSEWKPETVTNVFWKTCADRGDSPALRVMRNKKELVWTWA